MGRCALIVLDGMGIGEAPDADRYGDAGSHTLGHVLEAAGPVRLPTLEALGLGCCRPLHGLPCRAPRAAHGVALPASPGKDSTTGHWELCGLILERPFPTYPDGFPPDVIDAFARTTGRDVLGNHPASGTAVIEEYGPEHLRTGAWIVYTSADSVFQIAAHEEVVGLEELDAAARSARAILTGPHGVSRVITRPFVGEPGGFRRTANRRDHSLPPPGPTLLERLDRAGVRRVGVGKIDDLFAHRHIESIHTAVNAEAYRLIEAGWRDLEPGFLFANVIEFDQSWGHRNDPAGFAEGLRELDAWLGRFVEQIGPDDLVIFTADHGNDPTTSSTDHAREIVPVLAVGPSVRPVPLGERATFADVGATVAEYFGVESPAGTSFLTRIWKT